ncbi:dihydroxyacetone kinase phosphoryl donor subunit DhaM [Candidatus Symbiopectobacterium sp. NZEC151]|uniref:dihydroxyacetone kinase phosphoryl donor subunit DhaM n=2 Tax=unclassified Symbiopectobacterium TaxID=2794573 RepID=UPI0022274042|nr:dihydroxyacetone kinase phosphoryl donor subunit DhaM [Candidatus Symbiopectobacterium sp. NZEC151]MCW2474844.1 PTS-dependent dihydroxyacetone kinase phosphotransferase subunit DhaM [Candidatus Symbiopectobacterium sp. NZEC151]
MVNIVVVSHSKRLADGVVELAAQMTHGSVKFAVAAGIDDPDNPIGTDPIAVMTAIQEVQDEGDVLVMVDMGSAILSTDLALELLGEAYATRVHVCAAPLVEGTIAAAVVAASGGDIRQVMAEAHQALAAKYHQLNQDDKLMAAIPPVALTAETPASALTFSWRVANPAGIHARPASAIATCLNRYNADVQLVKGAQTVNGKSVNNIALLAIKRGDEVTLHASGEQAQQAIDAFTLLAHEHFGDRLEAKDAALARPERHPVGELVTATVCRVDRTLPAVTPRVSQSAQAELAQLAQAIDAAVQDLDELCAFTAQRLSDKEAGIFLAHRMMLEDGELYAAVAERMGQATVQVDALWLTVISSLAQEYQGIEDTYLRERYIDIYDVGLRVLRHLNHQPDSVVTPCHTPMAIVANLLLPSETVQLDPAWIKGVYFTDSGRNSHAAILATALGIPVFIDKPGHTRALRHGETITFNDDNGEITAEA